MKGIYSDKEHYTFHHIEGGVPISRYTPILPDKDEYERIIAEGKGRYIHRAPIWCDCDEWTSEEAASLISGILPRGDTEGRMFFQEYRAGPGGLVIDGIECNDFAFGLFTRNIDCYVDVLQILTRSPIEERAHPREWARYAHLKGLLPHRNRPDIDNSPLLSLLELDGGIVLSSQVKTEPLSQPASKAFDTNPWQILQKAAHNRFYNPRRNPDVKKKEVVEWLMSEGTRRGLPLSRNKASIMFGMIKPFDHNPKKKRVEPL